jgi:hypothetical protein
MIFLRPLLLLAVWFSASVLAAPPPEPPPPVYQVIALNTLTNVWVAQNGARPERLAVSPNRFSPPRPASAGGQVEFFREEPAAEPGQPPRRIVIGTAKIDTRPGANTLVVLYQPNQTAEPAWPVDRPRLMTLDNSTSGHPVGRVRAVNLGTRPLGLKIDGPPDRLEPGATAVLAVPPGPKPWLQAAVLGGIGWERVVGGPLRVREGTRLTLFFLDPLPMQGDPFPFGTQMRKIIDTPAAEFPTTGR